MTYWWIAPISAGLLALFVVVRGRRRYHERERDALKLTDERRTMLLDEERRQGRDRGV